jgi:tRNA G18 (ribose-2'-O)-methylase SpoU
MVAIVHNVRSLHNVGSIFRTSDGAGVEKIYLTGYTPGPADKFGKPIPQFAKVSLGAEGSIAWEKVRDINRVIKSLSADGYEIVALEQSARSEDYEKFRGRGKIALIVGNEVRGLSPAILKKCDAVIEIPMRGKKESLNVSVAFGIASYELSKKGAVRGK